MKLKIPKSGFFKVNKLFTYFKLPFGHSVMCTIIRESNVKYGWMMLELNLQ